MWVASLNRLAPTDPLGLSDRGQPRRLAPESPYINLEGHLPTVGHKAEPRRVGLPQHRLRLPLRWCKPLRPGRVGREQKVIVATALEPNGAGGPRLPRTRMTSHTRLPCELNAVTYVLHGSLLYLLGAATLFFNRTHALKFRGSERRPASTGAPAPRGLPA